MNARGKSDSPIVPKKRTNKADGAPSVAESAEGRGLAKGNSVEQTRTRTQRRILLQRELDRVRQAARRDAGARFTAIDHGWLVKFIEHRIAEQRVVRHVKKWLNAGVLEDGKRIQVQEGTPQGGSVSPLLANIYLHYVFDLWVHAWRQKHASGEVIVVRFADDFIVGFQRKADAERFLGELRERFARFNLELHPDKTRLLEFGRYAAKDRAKWGQGKPETFHFLGFTHICSRTRKGTFTVRRKTKRKKMLAKLQELKRELWRRMHEPIDEVGAWLRSVLRGHYNYYAVPRNIAALSAFRDRLVQMWKQVL